MKPTEIEHAKIRKLCVKNLKVKNADIIDLKTKNINSSIINSQTSNITNLVSENSDITNLKVATINGESYNSSSTFNFDSFVVPIKYVNNVPQRPIVSDINPVVSDLLWEFALLNRESVNLNTSSGRMRNNILNNYYNCIVCPPYLYPNCSCPIPGYAVFDANIIGNKLIISNIKNISLTNCPPIIGTIQIGQQLFSKTQFLLETTIIEQLSGTPGSIGEYLIENEFDNYNENIFGEFLALSNLTENQCIQTPLRIFGSETISLTREIGDDISVMTSISYNLNMVNRTLSPKIAAVFVQICWIEPGTEIPQIENVELDTMQYEPSILSYGEQMNNTVFLPSELVDRVAQYNALSDLDNAAVQLLVYVEDGMQVLFPVRGAVDPSQPRINYHQSAISSRRIKSSIPRGLNDDTFNYSKTFGKNLKGKIFDIPLDLTKDSYEMVLFGAGGGGGSSTMIEYAGGGGGSGDFKIIKGTKDLGFTSIKFFQGMGGESDQEGVSSGILLIGPGVETVELWARGGRPGQRVVPGSGGDGGFGGGGGGTTSDIIVFNGGNGKAPGILCPDGSNATNGRNGQPCSDVGAENACEGGAGGGGGYNGEFECSFGGRGGRGFKTNLGFIAGGGGGGGNIPLPLNGYGTDVPNVARGGAGGDGDDPVGRGKDATGPALGGGGARSKKTGERDVLGGKGGNGALLGPFYS